MNKLNDNNKTRIKWQGEQHEDEHNINANLETQNERVKNLYASYSLMIIYALISNT